MTDMQQRAGQQLSPNDAACSNTAGCREGHTGTSDEMLARLDVLPGAPSELLLGVRLPYV